MRPGRVRRRWLDDYYSRSVGFHPLCRHAYFTGRRGAISAPAAPLNYGDTMGGKMRKIWYAAKNLASPHLIMRFRGLKFHCIFNWIILARKSDPPSSSSLSTLKLSLCVPGGCGCGWGWGWRRWGRQRSRAGPPTPLPSPGS